MSGPWPNGWRWRWSPAAAAAWWERCSTWAWSGPPSCGRRTPGCSGACRRRGLVIVAFYKLTRTEGQGTNDIIEAVHHGRPLSPWLLPAIFLGTILTHLCGGSAGREGAALQMGGTIGRCTGTLFNLDDRDLRTAVMAGMAAFFSGAVRHASGGHGLCHDGHQHRRGVPCGVHPLSDGLTGVLLDLPAAGGGPHPLHSGGSASGAADDAAGGGAGGGLRPGLRPALQDAPLRGAQDEAVSAQRLDPGGSRRLRRHRADISVRDPGLQRRRHGRHRRRRGTGDRPAGGLFAEDPLHRRDPVRRLQGRRGGPLLLRGSCVWLCGGAAAGHPGGLRRGAGTGVRVLRGHQLPSGVHLPGHRAVRGWRPAVLRPRLRTSAICSPGTTGSTPVRPSSTPS